MNNKEEIKMLRRAEMKEKLKKAMRVYFCVDDFKKDSYIFHIGFDLLLLIGKLYVWAFFGFAFSEFLPEGLLTTMLLIGLGHILAGEVAIVFRELKFLFHFPLILFNLAEEIFTGKFSWARCKQLMM